MKIIAIIQARMESTRLPGKVLKDICGTPILEHIVSRIQISKYLDEVMIATSQNEADDAIERFARQCNVAYYRGSQENVLERFAKCAELYEPDVIVRLTADNALVDADIIDEGITFFLQEKNLDYLYYREGLPLGMGVEIFRFEALLKAYKESTDRECLEHVTPYIYRNPQIFNVKYGEKIGEDLSCLRWTIDTAEDYELVSNIYQELYYKYKYEFHLQDILKVYKYHDEWKEINSTIEQVKISYGNN